MIIEIKIPSPGESVTEVAIGHWLIKDNDFVEKDQEIAEVETDKATLPLISPESGRIKIIAPEGEKITVGDVACAVDTSVKQDKIISKTVGRDESGSKTSDRTKTDAKAESESLKQNPTTDKTGNEMTSFPQVKATPVARKLMEENNLSVDDIIMGLKKLTRRDVELISQNPSPAQKKFVNKESRNTKIVPMSPLRRKLGKRLVSVKNETAMLTTFNEVDMNSLMSLRKKYQLEFQELHGVKLGLMSFFLKACALSLGDFNNVNSMIEDDKIITPDYVDISIAVQTEKGLMVPVVRNADRLSIPEIEREIADLARKARAGKLSIAEMTGGTFTITNGGVFGSMLSTPIINPPQSAILGMHNIIERPVVVHGRIEARPMMYLALSYDHRLIDGKDSVSFLVKVKELIENPTFMTGTDHEKTLLEL